MNRDEFFRLQGLVASAKNAIDELFREVVECVGVSTEESTEYHAVQDKRCTNCFWCTASGCTHGIARKTTPSICCLWFKDK